MLPALAAQTLPGEPNKPLSDLKKDAKKKKEEKRAPSVVQVSYWGKDMPVVMVREENPWTGGSGPTLALYPEGKIIYWSPKAGGGEFHTAQLSEPEKLEFLNRVGVDALPLDGTSNSPGLNYLWLDAATYTVILRSPDRPWRSFANVGSLRGAWRGQAAGVSAELGAVLDFLATYRHPMEDVWVPETVEVTLWPMEKGDGPVLPWPAGLPTLNAARKDPEEGSYILVLTREQYANIRPMLDHPQRGQRWRLDGKLWLVNVAYRFPHVLPTNLLMDIPRKK